MSTEDLPFIEQPEVSLEKSTTNSRARLYESGELQRLMERQGVPRNFIGFKDGDPVRVYLMGTRIENFVTPNGLIAGHLTSVKDAYFQVEYAEGFDGEAIEGREIGLAHDARMPLPMGRTTKDVTLVRCFAPFRDFVYYFPTELDPNDVYQYPTPEQQHRTLSRYGKVVVGSAKTVLFDVLKSRND